MTGLPKVILSDNYVFDPNTNVLYHLEEQAVIVIGTPDTVVRGEEAVELWRSLRDGARTCECDCGCENYLHTPECNSWITPLFSEADIRNEENKNA